MGCLTFTTQGHEMTKPIVNVRFDRAGLSSPNEELEQWTRKVLSKVMTESGWSNGELSVLYCSAKMMRQLNAEFRQIDSETDVLSFPFSESLEELQESDDPYLGDLAICPKYCRDNLKGNRTLASEIELMLIHGLLHLLGFDHQTDDDHDAMEEETARLKTAVSRLKRPNLTMPGDKKAAPVTKKTASARKTPAKKSSSTASKTRQNSNPRKKSSASSKS